MKRVPFTFVKLYAAKSGSKFLIRTVPSGFPFVFQSAAPGLPVAVKKRASPAATKFCGLEYATGADCLLISFTKCGAAPALAKTGITRSKAARAVAESAHARHRASRVVMIKLPPPTRPPPFQ